VEGLNVCEPCRNFRERPNQSSRPEGGAALGGARGADASQLRSMSVVARRQAVMKYMA